MNRKLANNFTGTKSVVLLVLFERKLPIMGKDKLLRMSGHGKTTFPEPFNPLFFHGSTLTLKTRCMFLQNLFYHVHVFL